MKDSDLQRKYWPKMMVRVASGDFVEKRKGKFKEKSPKITSTSASKLRKVEKSRNLSNLVCCNWNIRI